MEQNHNMLRGISENGGIVFYGVDSTEIVREMERLHKTSAVTTAALGRLLTAASMMGIMLKSTQDSVTLQIKGGGPLGTLLAVLVAVAVYGVLLIKLHCIEEGEMDSMAMGRKLTRICRKLHLM